MILGLSLIILASAIAPKPDRPPGKVAGTSTNPLLVDNKFCDNPGLMEQAFCASFIKDVEAAPGSQYQDVQGDVKISGKVQLDGTTAATPLAVKNNNGQIRLISVSGGNYIESADTNWTVSKILKFTGLNGAAGTFSFIGDVTSTGTWGPSDIRLKKNIEVIPNPLNKLKILEGVTFNWRKDEFPQMGFTDGRQIGLIAQDVEKTFPELVNTDSAGYKSVAYDKFTAVLLEAIKQQQKEIESLQNQIKELQAK